MIVLNEIAFSVARYDRDGDIYEEGIFIHFDEMAVRVAMTIEDYDAFVKKLEGMREEIEANL